MKVYFLYRFTFRTAGKTEREPTKEIGYSDLAIQVLEKRLLHKMEGVLGAVGFSLPSDSQNQTAVEV